MADLHDAAVPEATPASELIKAGRCTPQCMIASGIHSEEACRCRCEGTWHGVLADVLVESERDRRSWWEKCHRGGWSTSEVESYVPICRTVKHENALWQRCKSMLQPFLMVAPAGRAWRVVHDHGTFPYRMGGFSNDWSRDGAAKLANRFLRGLLHRRRISGACPPPGEHIFVLGVRSLDEARVIGTLLGECFAGNHDGISRAVCVLEGHQDPCEIGLMPKPYLANLPVPNYLRIFTP